AATASPTTSIASAPQGDPVVQVVQVDSATNPVDVAVRAGDPTLYVVQQNGQVIAHRADTVETMLDVSDIIVAGGEQGLLGLAFHPTESFAYVNYTDRSGDTVIAEYTVDGNGVFDPGSARILLTIDQPYTNHNGGEVLFGPDGMLYIGTGDGGAGGDPERRALDVSSPLGKILRIDVTPSDTAPYTIPADNPFVAVDGARGEIWAIGMRNPWRMSFDRPTGDLWIADVGQNQWEEIDVAWAADGGGRGMNFGWSAFEGNHRFNDDQSPDGATPPIHEYEHVGEDCSVSGGVLYRGAAIPALVGWYVFADFCSGQVRALKIEGRAVSRQVALGRAPNISAINEGPDGELLVLSLNGPISAITPG
ncbi:MAG: PQQ-dependent sugar dehydrogenase, partial [Actinomycetota bacterium]|nr:PQQ-dependent sugar dehydrogenase [Actinomycetota bacterium]